MSNNFSALSPPQQKLSIKENFILVYKLLSAGVPSFSHLQISQFSCLIQSNF
jgi:hypothetical protein